MALTGTVKSYNPHKGWGFVECNGQDLFLNKRELKGFCVSTGNQVQFTVAQGERGSQATDVTVLVAPAEASYFGEIKSFNQMKGYGFISCEAFPGQDVFVLRSELPGGFGPEGGHCRFKVTTEEKGPSAKEVQLLGAAGNQVQQMKQMMGFGGGYGGGFGGGWGGKGGGKGFGGKDGGKSSDNTCWDFKKTGACPRGAECKFQH
ncbi:unnamed protein product [Polarella glacialis]|uniref:C3H1-type domain-containing protein n=1 Tax=Polarella glacialis TaxID=89957 RepID=A0A813H2K3_POLGL|nr:unnamed protein product [Polarella glacialis]CAE8648334.1 unnamed protein product [Polarella glacialis]